VIQKKKKFSSATKETIQSAANFQVLFLQKKNNNKVKKKKLLHTKKEHLKK
jgi:hypothetical protein